jgi:hypothetical protein
VCGWHVEMSTAGIEISTQELKVTLQGAKVALQGAKHKRLHRKLNDRGDAVLGLVEERRKEEEFNRLPWLGQSGRAAAGCACTAAALRC